MLGNEQVIRVPSAALKRWLDGTLSCECEIQIGKRIQVLIGCFNGNIDPVFLLETGDDAIYELAAELVLHEPIEHLDFVTFFGAKMIYGSTPLFLMLNFQKSMITEEDKLIRQPLFAKGCLTFKNSGHTLILDREYYRCSEQVKGNCGHKEEKMIRVKDMVKRFDNLITKFELPEGEASRVFDELLMVMVKQWRRASRRDVHLEEILVSTGNIIIDQIKKRREVSKRDFLEFKRTFYILLKNQYEEMLFNYLLDPLFTLNPWPKEQDEMAAFLRKSMGISVRRIRTTFSWHVRKLYLSDDGQIDSLEFEN